LCGIARFSLSWLTDHAKQECTLARAGLSIT